MVLQMNNLMKALCCIIALLVASSSVLAGVAGHVMFVNGEVKLSGGAGKSHLIKKGEAINEGIRSFPRLRLPRKSRWKMAG